MKKLLCTLAIICGMIGFSSIVVVQPIFAAGQDVPTNVIGNGSVHEDGQGSGIWTILNIVLTVMTFGVVTLATLGLIISGAQYITSADNPERMAKAKNRIINVIIGLVAYAVMWAALNWLLPGGLFH